jgi:nicotinamide riboside transporter PnuC
MDWIALVLSIVGIVLNAKKIIYCWIVWQISNVCWIIYLWPTGQKAQIILWVVFGAFNTYGWIQWNKDRR